MSLLSQKYFLAIYIKRVSHKASNCAKKNTNFELEVFFQIKERPHPIVEIQDDIHVAVKFISLKT